MSFQLIYTSAPELLELGMTGYGTVARSEAMPKGLAKKLIALSDFKEEHDIKGPQYSYRVLDCTGKTYHLFTSTQNAGADHTGRNCHLSHHLILSKEEAAQLRQDTMRPTPAGLILALLKERFWAKRWQGAPTSKLEEPQLLGKTNLPDAGLQTQWKIMTGHKINARAFSTAPFEHDCLGMVPRCSQSQDILQLLHESDWLDSSHGWGKTFTTQGTLKDRFSDTQRIFVAEGSDLEGRAQRTGRPILRVRSDFVLPSTGPTPLAITSAEGESPIVPSVPSSTVKPSPCPKVEECALPTAFPYHYIENRDEDIYPQAHHSKKNLTWIVALSTATLAAAASFLFFIPAGLEQKPQAQTGRKTVATAAPIPPKKQVEPLGKHVPPPQAPPPRPPIAEATTAPAPPTADTEARAIAIKPEGTAQPSPTPPLSPATSSTPKILQHAIAGAALPEALGRLLQNAPILIEDGFIRAGNLEGDTIALPLARHSYNILIEALPKGRYLLSPVQDGVKKTNHRMILEWDESEHQFTVNGKEGYLLLTTAEHSMPEQPASHILLLPRITKKLVRAPHELSNDKRETALNLQPANIRLLSASKLASQAKLALKPPTDQKAQKEKEKIKLYRSIPLTDDSILSLPFLPELAEKSSLCDSPANKAEDMHYSWGAEPFANDSDTMQNFSIKLKALVENDNNSKANFDRIANSCCAGMYPQGKRIYSFANFYSIILQLETEKNARTRTDLIQQYYKLFEHPDFAQLLQQGLGELNDMALLPMQLKEAQPDDLLAMKYIESQLMRPQVCKKLRVQICQFIGELMAQTENTDKNLKESQQEEEQLKLQLELQDIDMDEKSIHWHFKLVEK